MFGCLQQHCDLPAECHFLCNMITGLAEMEYVVLFLFYDTAVILVMHLFCVLAFAQ